MTASRAGLRIALAVVCLTLPVSGAAPSSIPVRTLMAHPERYHRKVVRLTGKLRIGDRHGWDLMDIPAATEAGPDAAPALPPCIHLLLPDTVLGREHGLDDAKVKSVQEAAKRARILAERRGIEPNATVKGRYTLYDEREFFHLTPKEREKIFRSFAQRGDCFGELVVYDLVLGR